MSNIDCSIATKRFELGSRKRQTMRAIRDLEKAIHTVNCIPGGGNMKVRLLLSSSLDELNNILDSCNHK